MTRSIDEQFYDRADAIITIANEQAGSIDMGKVSASLMYATARYNSFISACNATSAEDLASGKDDILRYFVDQYRMMLADNLDDYIENFDSYTSASENPAS